MLERTSSGRGSDRFVARRRVRRRRIAFALLILLVLAAGGVVYELHQPALRISHVEIFGADQSLADYAYAAMRGSYLGIIPTDSTFFFPAGSIRSAILAAHPDIAAVSIFRNGFTGLSIQPSERVAIADWCGLSPTPPGGAHGSDEYCYVFDASGFVFAAASSSTVPINSFSLYSPLVSNAPEPLGATLANADQLPATFDFARQLGTFGSNVTRIVIRDDEVDQILASGTRVTYILGDEQNAYTALSSARDTVDLADGSVEYVDLRFDGKMYVKKIQK